MNGRQTRVVEVFLFAISMLMGNVVCFQNVINPSIRNTACAHRLFLSASQENDSSKKDHAYRYRKAREADIVPLSKLLVETFDQTDDGSDGASLSPILFLFGSKKARLEKAQEEQLRRRWTDLIIKTSVAHTWIVVELVDDNPGDGPREGIVGFMELGSLPLPVPIISSRTQANVSEDDKSAIDTNGQSDGATQSSIWSEALERRDAGSNQLSSPERPFVANLAVAKAHRRQGIATTLVRLAMKQSLKWRPTPPHDELVDWSVFLSVDYDNESAIRLYNDRLGFKLVFDETETLSIKLLKRLKRKPRVYFEKKLH